MKKVVVVGWWLISLFLPIWGRAATLGELRLSLVQGDVQILTEDTKEWAPAAINLPLRAGDRLWVPDGGRAEVEGRNGTAIRLEASTALEILTLDPEAAHFFLSQGQVYVEVMDPGQATLQLDTPVASIRAFERATFNLDQSAAGESELSLFRGTVFAENQEGETRVDYGNMLVLTTQSAELSPLGPTDDWEGWNRERDRQRATWQDNARYLPPELAGYGAQLDGYGHWEETLAYGYVWTPTEQLPEDWAPYRHGRWVWINGDYVWVAKESWGWMPYHYGRWSYIPTVGWCWVPPGAGQAYWGPGYVGWVQTPTYVGWVPLAPGETYYGYGNFGPASVNLLVAERRNLVVEERYRNIFVHNGSTIVHRETFLRGKHRRFDLHENPFLRQRPHLGRPLLEPTRENRWVEWRSIPKMHQPPPRIREIESRDSTRHRHFVRERERSVFRFGGTTRPLVLEERHEPRRGGPGRPTELEAGGDHERGRHGGGERNSGRPGEVKAVPDLAQPPTTPAPGEEKKAPSPAAQKEGADRGRKPAHAPDLVTPAARSEKPTYSPPVRQTSRPGDDEKPSREGDRSDHNPTKAVGSPEQVTPPTRSNLPIFTPSSKENAPSASQAVSPPPAQVVVPPAARAPETAGPPVKATKPEAVPALLPTTGSEEKKNREEGGRDLGRPEKRTPDLTPPPNKPGQLPLGQPTPSGSALPSSEHRGGGGAPTRVEEKRTREESHGDHGRRPDLSAPDLAPSPVKSMTPAFSQPLPAATPAPEKEQREHLPPAGFEEKRSREEGRGDYGRTAPRAPELAAPQSKPAPPVYLPPAPPVAPPSPPVVKPLAPPPPPPAPPVVQPVAPPPPIPAPPPPSAPASAEKKKPLPLGDKEKEKEKEGGGR